MNDDFVREFDVHLLSKTLRLHQRVQGDVSCVVWDASIVLAKYLEKLCENREHFLENLNVVELGSGVGCVGLTAACLGYGHNLENQQVIFKPQIADTSEMSKYSSSWFLNIFSYRTNILSRLTQKNNCSRANVLLTDLPEALPLLKLNVENNRSNWQNSGGNAEATSLNWGENGKIDFVPDLILLADCVYYKKSIDCLVKTLRDLATSKTKIFLSQELRDSEKQRECWSYFVSLISQYFSLNAVPLNEQNADYSSPDILLMQLAKL